MWAASVRIHLSETSEMRLWCWSIMIAVSNFILFFNLAQMNEGKASHTIPPPHPPPYPNTHTRTTQETTITEFNCICTKIVFPGGHHSSETAKNRTEQAEDPGHERWGAETSDLKVDLLGFEWRSCNFVEKLKCNYMWFKLKLRSEEMIR